ncbi:MAG: hypothetical protein ACI9R3_006444, partial [Verrucomicrobiales bacterium]
MGGDNICVRVKKLPRLHIQSRNENANAQPAHLQEFLDH